MRSRRGRIMRTYTYCTRRGASHKNGQLSKGRRHTWSSTCTTRGDTFRGRWGEEKQAGGVATLVRKKAQHRLKSKKATGEAQALMIDVQGWYITNVYAPPRAREDLYEAMLQVAVEDQVPHNKMLWGGDWNEESGGQRDGDGGQLLDGAGPTSEVNENIPTFWRGSGQIDWFMCSEPGRRRRRSTARTG